jgi:copper(I)-binding protein
MIENGIASMRQIESLVVAAGQFVVLKPEGLHLMLMRPKRKLAPNEDVSFTFTTASDAKFVVAFRVQASGGKHKGSHAGHKGSHDGHAHPTQ